MPIPPQLQRKLQQTLGTEAGDALVTYLDSVEAMRGDIAELRHEMQRGDEKLAALIATSEARMEAAIEKGLREQTRFFFLAWSVVLASIIGLYAR